MEPPSGSTKPPEAYKKPELSKIISAYEFQDIAARQFSKKAYAFYSSAATDLVTYDANRDIFRRIMLRPRVMRNVKHVSIKRSILGYRCQAPFFVSPTAMASLAHPEGEKAIARACANEGLIQIISSNASFPLADIVAAGKKDQVFFLQLYVNQDRSKSEDLLREAQILGIKAIVVTVDAPVPGKREADERVPTEGVQSGLSGAKAESDSKGAAYGRVMGKYIDASLTFDDVPWIKRASRGLPIILKGVQYGPDAYQALLYGVQGIILSNHGGRSIDTAQSPILALLELHRSWPVVLKNMEVYIDGGILRGTDILKALALGATAVGIGRPWLYSLAYGEQGARHLSRILKDELENSLRLCGMTDVDGLDPSLLNTGDIDHLVPMGDGHPYASRISKL
ncbi:hypothetical protein MMC25_002805 [Agyrium rufum]|nr:hypothetical protein [Agyrium rufum]